MAQLIASKVGEGFGRPQVDNELPIDINYGKLADWLIDRKQLPADWRKRLQVISAKVGEVSLSLPAGLQAEVKGQDGSAAWDYYRVREVRDKLAASTEKNFFGYYTGTAGVWDKLVAAYEKSNVHLGEAAQILLRNVDYELPYVDKQEAKLQQQLADLERKQAEYLKSASTSALEFKQECKQLKIEGNNVVHELLQLLDELPAMFATSADLLRADEITNAMQHYQEFTGYAHGETPRNAQHHSVPDSAEPLLATLEEVRTSRQSAADAPADSDASASTHMSDMLAAAEQDTASKSNQVDWDIGMDDAADSSRADAQPMGVSWDVEDDAAAQPAESSEGPVEISWDFDAVDVSAEAEQGPAADAAGAGAEISWDIDMTAGEGDQPAESGEGPGTAASHAPDAAVGNAEPVTTRSQYPVIAVRLAKDGALRARLLDDILELRSFLRQRQVEATAGGHDMLTAAAPEAVQLGADALGSMLSAVDAALASMTNDRTKQLLLIGTSKRYLGRLTQALQEKAGQEAKFKRLSREAADKRVEVQQSLMSEAHKAAAFRKRTAAIKQDVECTLAHLYQGRTINIIGEINNLI